MSAALALIATSTLGFGASTIVMPKVAQTFGRILITPMGKFIGLLGMSAIGVDLFLTSDSEFGREELGISIGTAALFWVLL